MSELIISLSKIQKLNEELNNLNKEYLALYEEMEDLNKKKELLESLYMAKLGALVFLKLEKEIEYRRLKKKLNLIIQSKNKKEKLNIAKIDEMLKLDLKNFYIQLDSLRENMKNSKIYLELPTLTNEEVKKVKEIFRRLAKKFHPDLNKNLSHEEIELWNRVKEAYENNDLVTLIVLDGIANDMEIKEDIKASEIEENIKKVKSYITKAEKLIDKSLNEFPLNLRELIYDEAFIKNKKDILTSDIKNYENKIMELNILIEETLGDY